MAFRDQRPQQAPLLPLVRGLPSSQAPLQRPRSELVLSHALRCLHRRSPRLRLVDALRRQPLCDVPGSVSLVEP